MTMMRAQILADGPGAPGATGFVRLAGLPLHRATERLWRNLARRIERPPFPHARVLLAGFEPDAVPALRDQLRGIGVAGAASCPSLERLSDAAAAADGSTVIVVNGDAFADAESLVDTLLALRRQAPWLAVILVSAKVARDDFGAERRMICDATLRHPVSSARMKQALQVACPAGDEATPR